MGDGKFKSIEPNEEILEIGKDENEETPEQLELERKKVEQEQNFEVGFQVLEPLSLRNTSYLSVQK